VIASPLLSLFAGPLTAWCQAAAAQLQQIATLSPGAF
jgi:multicomponent K+:H+ antiporter subunit D